MSENIITIEKLEIYMLFEGDDDDFSRRASSEQKKAISSIEFYTLRHLFSDFHLVKNNLASENFEAEFYKKVDSLFYNHEAVQRFYQVYDQIKRD